MTLTSFTLKSLCTVLNDWHTNSQAKIFKFFNEMISYIICPVIDLAEKRLRLTQAHHLNDNESTRVTNTTYQVSFLGFGDDFYFF